MELDSLPQPELDAIERIGNADVVIGILDGAEEDGVEEARTQEALAGLSKPLRAVVVSDSSACRLPPRGPGETAQQSISNAYRRVFAVGGKLGARGGAVLASSPHSAAGNWICRLIQPVVELGFDLVAPCYTRRKMEGLLNRSMLAPLHRALYGEALQNPLGPDFGFSGKLVEQVVRPNPARRRGVEGNWLALLAPAAVCGGLQVCETQLGARKQRPADWENLSALLAEVLGPMFLEMETGAAHWQSVRSGKSVPRFGAAEARPEAGDNAVDAHGMVESFHLGTQNLQDVWGLILPPATLLELKRLSRLKEDQFRMPDRLWVRIVYDFALGHRLRTISRDHLLRSITPLYLGWIASYALEMQTAEAAEADARVERLAKAYEDDKPYLVSRWRWPDRFNP